MVVVGNICAIARPTRRTYSADIIPVENFALQAAIFTIEKAPAGAASPQLMQEPKHTAGSRASHRPTVYVRSVPPSELTVLQPAGTLSFCPPAVAVDKLVFEGGTDRYLAYGDFVIAVAHTRHRSCQAHSAIQAGGEVNACRVHRDARHI